MLHHAGKVRLLHRLCQGLVQGWRVLTQSFGCSLLFSSDCPPPLDQGLMWWNVGLTVWSGPFPRRMVAPPPLDLSKGKGVRLNPRGLRCFCSKLALVEQRLFHQRVTSHLLEPARFPHVELLLVVWIFYPVGRSDAPHFSRHVCGKFDEMIRLLELFSLLWGKAFERQPIRML